MTTVHSSGRRKEQAGSTLRPDADLDHLARSGLGSGQRDAPGRTWEIFARPGFLRTLEEFKADNPPVSSASFFLDDEWILDPPPPGTSRGRALWFGNVDSELALELKVAGLVAMLEPGSLGYSIERGTKLISRLTVIGSWMTATGLTSISELGEGVGSVFLSALAEFVARMHAGDLDEDSGDWDPRGRNGGKRKLRLLGRNGRITVSTVEVLALALIHLHTSSESIERLTGRRVRGAPFESDVAADATKGWTERQERATERIPDAVLRALLPGARQMLGVPAEDVCRLLREFVGRCAAGATQLEAGNQLAGFEFRSLAPGEPSWRPRLMGYMVNAAKSVRTVLHQVLCAAILIVMIETGMRPGEVLGLMGGRRDRRAIDGAGASRPDIPRCVSEALSKSGFSISILLHGHIFKKKRRPLPATWLLAGRQAGEEDPWVLKALNVLEDIAEILRPLAPKDERGLLVFDIEGGYDGPLEVSRATVGRNSQQMRRAIPRFSTIDRIVEDEEAGRSLDEYKETNGGCIAPYQCRKTYAQTRYAIDQNLLLAISHQLHHVSPDETYEDYVTDDPSFRRELEQHRSRRSAYNTRLIMDGIIVKTGTMSPVIDGVLARMRTRPAVSIRDELWQGRIEEGPGIFAAGRLRPMAGAENILADVGEPVAPGQSADGGRDGPAAMRAFAAARRRCIEVLETCSREAARPHRDRAIEAARRLNEMGFAVPDTVIPTEQME